MFYNIKALSLQVFFMVLDLRLRRLPVVMTSNFFCPYPNPAPLAAFRPQAPLPAAGFCASLRPSPFGGELAAANAVLAAPVRNLPANSTLFRAKDITLCQNLRDGTPGAQKALPSHFPIYNNVCRHY